MLIRSTVLALAAATLAVPAVAADEDATTVRYADLDLTTEHGQEVLSRRIDAAARAMCGMDDVRTGTIMRNSKAGKCFERARASVNEQVAQLVARSKTRG